MLKTRFNKILTRIRAFFINEPQIWLSFLIPFVLMLIVYLIFGVYPVKYKRGENLVSNSVLSLDLNAQYSYYFAYMKDVLAGKASLLYSWSRSLSGEFVGMIGYYLFSPFNILVWLFPLSHLTEGLLLMIITKMGFVGGLMAVYLSKSRKFSRAATITFSVMYAFTSYAIEQTMNPMWLDGVMILPLVAMGIEALLREGKYKLLIFSLFYSFVTNFYIGYMTGIFAALYFIYYVFASRKANAPDVKTTLKRSGLFAASAVISVMCACFLLLPVYSSLTLGKFGFTDPDYSLKNSFEFLDITRKLFPNSYDTVRMEGLPFLYCGTTTLLMLPAYFFSSRVRRAKRISGAVLIAALFVCMYIRPVDMLWHGGQMPNWLPYRYSFMLCFLFLAFGAEAFENIKTVKGKTIGITALILTLLLLYLEKADTFIETLNGNKGREVFDRFTVILPALGFIILSAAFIILAKNKLARRSFAAGVALVTLIGLEAYYNAQWSVYKQHTDIVYSTRNSFNDVIIPTREVADRVQKEDPGFYRMEKTYDRSANDPMALGMKGVTHSSSLLNKKAITFLQRMGYASHSHASRYLGATPVTDDLFGFKYILSCPDNNAWAIKSADDITVRDNSDTMPLAYLADPEVLNVVFDRYNVFENQARLLSAMLGSPKYEIPDYWRRTTMDNFETENIKHTPGGDNHELYSKINTKTDASLDYYFTAEEAGAYYMYIPTKYQYRCDLVVNDIAKGAYFEGDNHHIKDLGVFEAGEKVHVKLKLQKDMVYIYESYFMFFDKELYEADYSKLKEMNANTVFKAKSDTKLVITTDYEKDGALFVSVPKEPGWTVMLDGKKTDIVTLGNQEEYDDAKVCTLADSVILVEIPAGKHTVTMTFFPNLMLFGISVSFLGISLLILLGSFLYKKRKAREPSVTDEYDGYDPDYIIEPDFDNEEDADALNFEETQPDFDDFDYDEGENDASDG